MTLEPQGVEKGAYFLFMKYTIKNKQAGETFYKNAPGFLDTEYCRFFLKAWDIFVIAIDLTI